MKLSKKVTRLLTMLLCVGVLLTTTGCGKQKVSATESAKIYFNLLVHQDITDADKFGITEDAANDLIKQEKDITKTETRKNFAASGLTISEDKLIAIVDAQYMALKSTTVTIQATSESSTAATIVMKATYLDFTAIDQKAADDAQATVQALGLTNEKEALDKLKDVYIENIITGLTNAKPSTETNEDTYEFKKDSGDWVPVMDSEKFGEALINLVQKSNK